MFNWIKNLFTGTSAEAANDSAPYKVPTPAEAAPTPSVADKATEAMVKAVVPEKKKPAAKKAAPKTATKKPVAKKPAAIKAEPKKRGRKPKNAV